MSEAVRQTTITLLWSAIAGAVVVCGFVIERQDRVHTREISVLRNAVEVQRKEWREDIQVIDEKMDAILSRLPIAKE